MIRNALPLLFIFNLLLLSACQTRPLVTVDDFERAEDLQHWNITGRLGYRTAGDGGNASLDWRQRREGGRIHFSGPLGFGSAELRWDDTSAMLDTGREQLTATSPAALAWHLTGLMIPVDALYYWVRGLPWPWAESTPQYDDQGRLVTLDQLGWSLRFDRHERVAGLELPHRVRANLNGDSFTLIVQHWVPQP